MWQTLDVLVNGYAYEVRYSDAAYEGVYVPLLSHLASLHSETGQGRTIAFLAGPPAAGKSTMALLLERFAHDIEDCDLQVVGLDGFHHTNEFLLAHTLVRDGVELPLKAVKGAPESFDVAHFGEKLHELRDEQELYWPVYDRTIHDPVEDALPVSAPIVLVEGNWLLLDEEPWRTLVDLADYTVMLSADESLVRERAIVRKAKGGISRAEAEAHYERSDGPNVRRVLEGSLAADCTVQLLPDGDLRLAAPL